jgi:hypothetical protein
LRAFAEAIYREAIRAGVMERVRFQDLPGLADAVASAIAHPWLDSVRLI